MERIKEQFSEITKEVRTKHKLSQEQLAEKLFLGGGKQTVYGYEKSKFIMKLPEFVEFIQKFNETVIIDKNGLSLINDNLKRNNNEVKEKEETMRAENTLELVEKKGDVSFYNDKSTGKKYQIVEGIKGLLLVVSGSLEYVTVKQMGNIRIRYNTNGVHGYSIWVDETCYEDRFWILEKTEEAVSDMFLGVQKKKTISVMCSNLINKLDEDMIKLSDLNFGDSESFLLSIDDAINDGGYFRCECFTDIAMAYALNFGEIESTSFENAKWDCIEEAFGYLKKESLRTVRCLPSEYCPSELEFECEQNDLDDTSYRVTLYKDDKKLIFDEFRFGYDGPNLETVIDAVKDDYELSECAPTLSAYKELMCREDVNVVDDYNCLKLDIESMIEFFGKDYLDNLIEN